jgi:hypothetical protein
MAMVPGCDQALIEPAKITDYLLSTTHAVGRAKAGFFKSFGFRDDAPEEMVQALLAHIQGNAVADVEASPFGTKYRVDGPLASPDGRNPLVSTVWIIPGSETNPRFVTAFPC